MTNIKQTDVMPPEYLVTAKCFHQARGDQRGKAARLYMVSEQRDGSNHQEYMLTRYITPMGKAMSAIMQVEGRKDRLTLVEERVTDRKNEEQMIMAWYQEKGSLDFGRDNKS